MRALIWSETEINVLKEIWPNTRDKESVLHLLNGKNVVQASRKFKSLGLENNYVRNWTPEEDAILIEKWPHIKNNREILDLFQMRTEMAIGIRCTQLKLKKSKEIDAWRGKRLMEGRTDLWSEEELEILIKAWPTTENEEIAKLIPNKKFSAIIRRAENMRLKKSIQIKRKATDKMIQTLIHRNKYILGRPMSHEFAKSEALKYNSKQEFRKMDSSLYTYANKEGILNEICSHMIVGDAFNYPQTFLFLCIEQIFKGKTIRYNDRTALKPKEIDVFVVEDKIGFEYDGKNFHKDDGNEKSELCSKLGITLYKIEEVSKHHPEKFILESLSNFGFDVSKIDVEDTIKKTFSKKISIKTVDEIVKKYTTLKEFAANEKWLYGFLSRKKLLNQYGSHLMKKVLSKEEIITELKKCKTKEDFRLGSTTKGCYVTMMKKKDPEIMELYLSLPRKSNVKCAQV